MDIWSDAGKLAALVTGSTVATGASM